MNETLTFSEKAKGWTSFHSFIPDAITRLDNRLFTVKDGQIWLHNDENSAVRNNFYGEQFSSKISTVINEANSEDKVFKTIAIESNAPWDVTLNTNLATGTIAAQEFNARESRWFAHTRRNENAADFHGNAVQGIGNVISTVGLTVTYSTPPQLVNVGDGLYQMNGSTQEFIGVITLITGSVITVDGIINSPVAGRFSFAKKNARVEGGDIRGYYMDVVLENELSTPVSLFAINSNIVHSGVNIGVK